MHLPEYTRQMQIHYSVIKIQLKGESQVAYTPQLSYQSSCTLRRIAWALGIPMTKAIERVFDHMPVILDKEKVCQGMPG